MKGVLIFLPLLFAIVYAQDQSQATVNPEWFFGPSHYPHWPHIPPHYFLPHPHFFPRYPFPFPHNFTFPSPAPTSPSDDETQANSDVNDQKILFPFHRFPFHHYPVFPHHFFLPPHFPHGFPGFPFPSPFNGSNPFPFPFPFPTQPAQPPSSPSTTENDDEKILFPFHRIPFHSYHYPLYHPHFTLPPHFAHHFPLPFPFHFPSPSNSSFPFPSQAPTSPSTATNNENDAEKFVFPHPYMEMPPVSDDHMKCFLTVHDRSMKSCLNDFHSYLMTHQISVSSECCSALQNIEDSCRYNNPFLERLVQQCAAPTPSN